MTHKGENDKHFIEFHFHYFVKKIKMLDFMIFLDASPEQNQMCW